ncbi:hypothetical protein EDD37DRAFT_171066 [Exophiala viscosa]|uniref:uncharacterized protein n=1 Tax=Exophiala viscosa TaxID=2486360 RepID=UPI0021963785|nr:hypothetical protein EDD37DRAFT_171066 [Exophiala viscosa]
MTSTFAAQLRTIAAHSTNELDLRARRDAHAESLIFERSIAVKQDWETVYQICVEGFRELCLLDSRLKEFEGNLYSPQAKDQDREQLSKAQNEALGVVLERCLALLGSKVILRPGLRAVEWLVRRFRVHVYNTGALLATLLPYHETPIFQNVLSIIPANKLVNEWKFLNPYHKVAPSVPRHALIYTATNSDPFFSYFNNHTLRACQDGAGHSQLLRFWGSMFIEAVAARLNQVKSGRKEVEKQRLEDALLKIFPVLVDGFAAREYPEVIVTCFTVSLILASNSNLEDSVLDSMLRAVAPFVTDADVDPKSALACVAILAGRKTDRRLPKIVLETLMKVRDLKTRLLELRGHVTDDLLEALISSSLSGIKKSNHASRLSFVEGLLEMSLDLSDRTAISRFVAVLLRKLPKKDSTNAADSAIRAEIIGLLQKLNDNTAFSATFPKAVQLAGQSLADVETAIEGTIESTNGVYLIEPAPMDVDSTHPEDSTDAKAIEAMLASLPSKSVELSFLKTGHSALFDQLLQAFALCQKNDDQLGIFQSLPLWGQKGEQSSDLRTSFFLKVACIAVPAQQVAALRIIANLITSSPRQPSQFLIPYFTVLLADSAQSVRRSVVACLLALNDKISKMAKEDDDQQKATETIYDGLAMVETKRLAPGQAAKILGQVYIPVLEECVLDASHIRQVLETAFDSAARSSSSGARTANVELKKSLKHDLFELLIDAARGTPVFRVKVRLVELLLGVPKVGTTTTSKALAPVLKEWASLTETDAKSTASSANLSPSQTDAVMVQLINPRGKDAVGEALAMLNSGNSQLRSALVSAFFDRLVSIWQDMKEETQISSAVTLFDMAFSDNAAIAGGARDVFHSANLSTSVLSTLLDHACSGLAQMPTEVPAKKRRRTSHGRASIPRDTTMELDVADSRLTFALEIVENSKPENHPQLLGNLFEVLITLRRLKDKSTTESPYLLSLCLSSILAIIDKARQSRKPNLDMSSIRADLVTDCVRSSGNPQVQATALLLSASLASLAPERVLHTIMPIFTFMGHGILSKEDERSIYVTNQAIDHIIPPLVSTLKKQDARNLVHSTSSLLTSFVTAYDHIPQHRRTAFYQRLLNRLGAEDFAFAIIALLASRKRRQDISGFFTDLIGGLPAVTQLSTHRKLLGLVTDIFSPKPHNAEPLLDITKSSKPEEREREAKVLLEATANVLGNKGLKAQVKRIHKLPESDVEDFWAEYRNCIPQLLALLKDQKAHHPALIASTRRCLSALLELPSLAELLEVTPSLLQEMDQIDDKELQPLALRVLATQLQNNAPKDSKTQSAAIAILPTIETIIRTTQNEAFRHAAITSLDRIVEVYGRKSPDQIISTSNVLMESNTGLYSEDTRTQIMSLLCLASVVEVLKESAVPLVPPSMSKVLDLLDVSLHSVVRNVVLHNAAFTLISSFITHVPFMVSDENVVAILKLAHKSSRAKLEASCKESRIETLSLLAQKMDLTSITTSLNQVWTETLTDINVETATEYLDVLAQAIEKNTKATVVRSAESISEFMLQVLDLRRQESSLSAEDIDTIESKLQALSIPFIYKLNDTAFRPLFENWVDWAVKASDLDDDATADLEGAKSARQLSLFRFAEHFFSTLKSIVTSYAGYILDPANAILRSVADSADANENMLPLYKATLKLLTTVMQHDADGFFASPSHFSPLSELLVKQLTLAATKVKPLRAVVSSAVIPAIVALATATLDTPAHHHSINHGLCQLRHHASGHVRLAAIRTHIALTENEDVGEEWVNNVVVGTSTEGVGGSGETMVYVNESLEDDDEDVEREVRRWVRMVREMVGEDVFEV